MTPRGHTAPVTPAPVTPAGDLRVQIVTDLSHALALAPQWEALAEAVGAGPLTRPAYALSWWRHLGKGRLLLGVVSDGEDLLALAPLHERRVGPLTVARWLGHGLGTVTEALVRPGREDAARLLWSALTTRGRVLDLVEARAGGGGLTQLADHPGRGRRTRVEVRDRCPVADLDGEDGLGLTRRPEAKNLRQNLKKVDNALARSGHRFRLESAEDPAGFERLLPAIRAVFDAAEADRPRQHLLEPPYEEFVLDYLRHEVAAGRAVALLGRLEDQPVAFWLALRSADTLSIWIGRFAPDVASARPGHLLFRETFRWAAAHGLRRVDLLLGESQTKRQWSTGGYDTLRVTNGSPAAVAVVRFAEEAMRQARPLLSRART